MNDFESCGNCGHAHDHHYGVPRHFCIDCECNSYRKHTPADDPPHVPSLRLAELIGAMVYNLDALENCLSLDTAGNLRVHYLSECNLALDAIRQFNIKGE